mmetsp:Transcript_8869/g.15051  ORF Transcript_8869/g.15051 Transcript_8869/m.15051 type:complete len:451 (-) Transcript_8869:204-1556(-)
MTSSTNNNNTTTTSSQIVLTLAHLLQQHSLSYDSEKNSLLHTSVRCASHLANNTTGGGEVHIVLTGSPRPTFAETNAWLLEGSSSAAAAGNNGVSNSSSGGADNNDIAMTETDDTNDRPAHLKGSYSIADNVHHSSSNIYNNQEEEERMMQDDENTTKSELQDYITEFTDSKDGGNGSNGANSKRGTSGGGHNTSFIRRNTTGVTTTTNNNNNNADDSTNTTNRRRSTIDAAESSSSSVTNNTGPMVGQAVVNAISQSSGVGLQSSRSKLLQGTIDRPLWSQNRWTDGECLFSELVELCGMERFEMVGGAAHKKRLQQQQQGGPDDAAGGAGAPSLAVVASPPPATAATNMSANLITVPATTLREPNAGVSQTTMDEIARGVLRTVKRKKSPPASKVYIVVPGVNQGVSEEQRGVVVTSLKQAWEKLEQYNHMIGQPNLISGADLEFVDV